jgi:orotidine-5'-phosphate decarboxylase
MKKASTDASSNPSQETDFAAVANSRLGESQLGDPRRRLIFALDVGEVALARALIAALSDEVGCFKIGLELFITAGPAIIEKIHQAGGRVFLDLKLHDIPATVRRAAAAAARHGVDMLTVHAGEGPDIVAAAVKGAQIGADAGAGPGKAPSPQAPPGAPLVLGVTVLTSLSAAQIAAVGLTHPISELVALRARTALEAGCGGLVCSPQEVSLLRKRFGPDPRLVVPGVRPAWAHVGKDDQVRKATPAEVLRWGGDYVVVGRPIRDADDPAAAAARVVAELAAEQSVDPSAGASADPSANQTAPEK